MMPRGGKRSGTGPKPAVDPDTASLIRRDCEQRANLLRLAQAERRHTRKMEKRGFVRSEDGDEDPMHLVPLLERPEVGRLGIVDKAEKHDDELSEEARAAIDFMRTKEKHFGAYSEPLPRLSSGRKGIIDAVAADWGVSPRTVRSIWEEKTDV